MEEVYGPLGVLLNSDKKIPLRGHLSYMGGKARYAPVSLGKQNTTKGYGTTKIA